jgi:hypothetical protein
MARKTQRTGRRPLRGEVLDHALTSELETMVNEGFRVSPISLAAVARRLALGSRTTLYEPARLERIRAAAERQRQLCNHGRERQGRTVAVNLSWRVYGSNSTRPGVTLRRSLSMPIGWGCSQRSCSLSRSASCARAERHSWRLTGSLCNIYLRLVSWPSSMPTCAGSHGRPVPGLGCDLTMLICCMSGASSARENRGGHLTRTLAVDVREAGPPLSAGRLRQRIARRCPYSDWLPRRCAVRGHLWSI